jgi:hypothetical protein
LLGIAGRIAAGIVVLALLSTAVLAVRGAMQERRERAEQAWREARQCVLACAERPSLGRSVALRQCRERAQRAAELSLELPEHSGQQLELRAALDELVSAIDGGNDQRLASAIERSSRAGDALGWRMVHTRPH